MDRLGTLVLENHGTVTHGEFPMSFTSLHDLSADYLLKQMIEHEVISAIEKLADMMATAPSGRRPRSSRRSQRPSGELQK